MSNNDPFNCKCVKTVYTVFVICIVRMYNTVFNILIMRNKHIHKLSALDKSSRCRANNEKSVADLLDVCISVRIASLLSILSSYIDFWYSDMQAHAYIFRVTYKIRFF